MIKSNTKKGTRVVVIGNSKTKGREGTVVNTTPYRWCVKQSYVSVRLAATSDKPACNITILRKNVEVY